MTLANLINDLKQAVQEGKVDRRNAQESVNGRVIFPENFNVKKAEFKLENFNSDKPHTPLHHLSISAFPERSLDDVQSVLYELFTRAKDLRLGKGVADVKYDVLWTPEDFQKERKLKGLFSADVKFLSKVHNFDPKQIYIGVDQKYCRPHKIEATTKANKMVLKATRNYKIKLMELVEMLNPQFAKLNLSKEDANRLLRAVRNNPTGKYVVGRLEKALQPEKKDVMSVSLGGGVSFETKEVIELAVPTKVLKQYEEAIGKPLVVVSPKQNSQVTEFIKVYGLGGLLRGERLSDLQALAKDIPQMDLGFTGEYSINRLEAKEIFDKRIQILTEIYRQDQYYPHPPWCENLLKSVYKDIYSKDASVNDLSSKDKQKKLFENAKQFYKNNTDSAVEAFMNHFRTRQNSIVYGKVKKDASKIRRLKLPSQARLYSFGIMNQISRATPYGNDLSIDRTGPSDGDIHFWSRTIIDFPILLSLQEYACRKMGITFKEKQNL